MNANTTPYKVVAVFELRPGTADEEIRRSLEVGGTPTRLAAQAGFISAEVVRIDDDHTMSVQTWESPEACWAALQVVQSQPDPRWPQESILVSREFHAGAVVGTVLPA